jgi:hypothetical protein
VRTIVRAMDIDCYETYCAMCRYLSLERKSCSLFDTELSWWVEGDIHLYLRCAECMACDVQFMRDGRPE